MKKKSLFYAGFRVSQLSKWKNRKRGKRREQFRRPFVMTSFHILSVFGIDFYRDTANALFDDLAVIKDALFNGV